MSSSSPGEALPLNDDGLGDAVAVSVRNVSKCFQIYSKPEDRLKQSVLPRVQGMFGRMKKSYFREFWALRNISFDIRKGETLGVIGRNGSGKSTLLQIICGTLTPTSGAVEVNGRVAALLELGSGFNPEFTGRENIYMSCAVLGLSPEMIDARYEKIVAFADIGDFIEQPIKTYSSGMYVRLAFAVIVHADADILVIDEALSVGDTVFTQKCKRFLRKFIETGTLIFVSHDAASVLALCQSCIWIDKGELRMQSTAKTSINAYTQDCMEIIAGDDLRFEGIPAPRAIASDIKAPQQIVPEVQASFFEDIANAEGWKTQNAQLVSIRIANDKGQPAASFFGGEMLELTISAVAKAQIASPIIGFIVKDRSGQSLFGEHTYGESAVPVAEAGQNLIARFVFALPMLPSGDYSMTVSIADGTPLSHVHHHWLHDAAILKVLSSRERHGLVSIPFKEASITVI